MQYKPFPTELLPKSAADFVRSTAEQMQCDEAMVALPVLATLAGSIGTTRAANPIYGWSELPMIWAAVIARSGSVKTPPFEAAITPLEKRQHQAFTEYAERKAAYQIDKLHHDKALAAWKRGKQSSDEPPASPAIIPCKRYIIDDITIEGLLPILQENPRGVLLYPDELDGWVSQWGQYSQSKGVGSDRAKWLRLHRKGCITSDRKTNRELIHVPLASVSVAGTIQPGIFRRVMGGDNRESGATARLLIAQPPARLKRLNDRQMSQHHVRPYFDMVYRLLDLNHVEDEVGRIQPFELSLTREAFAVFRQFYGANALDQFQAAEDDEAALMAKIEAYALRCALILTLADDPAANAIEHDAMQRAVALAEWFKAEALRIYSGLCVDEAQAAAAGLVEWIMARGGRVTLRDLARGPRQFRFDPDRAESALQDLSDAGLGEWQNPAPGIRGGRPSRVFLLRRIRHGDGDETPDSKLETGVPSPSPVIESAAAEPEEVTEWAG